MRIARLDNMAALACSGDDCHAFLQGQLTQDVHRLADGNTLLAGWCNPKGRLQAVGQLLPADDRVVWILPKSLLDTTVQRLSLFKLRSKVEFDAAAMRVFGLLDAASDIEAAGLALPGGRMLTSDGRAIIARVVGDPDRAWCLASDTAADLLPAAADAGETDWTLANIRAGLPVIEQPTVEAFVPQMVNLDLLDGISFSKGCYVGQEVVARTQNLGRIKRRMFRYGSTGEASRGQSVLDANGSTVGKVVECARVDGDFELLAVIQLDAADAVLHVPESNEALSPLPLPYEIPIAD